MKISNVKKEDDVLEFTLEESTSAFANAIRRIIMSEIPVLAIRDVTFIDNGSALYDEVLSHRLGLIPLKTPARMRADTEVKYTLVKKGPCTVYSGDMKSSDSKLAPSDEKIPIVKLLEGQNIKLEATASLGTGKDHAKWQAAIASYSIDKDKFNFRVEKTGAMDPERAVVSAAKVLGGKAKELEKLAK
ncbi:TPA: DNA-directed RNA polymerase subunit D [archaeon]|nr:DNA-directed RNA polymerase subunit D [Candidatus Undinarchaeales archaeon SRR5007147.bin71]